MLVYGLKLTCRFNIISHDPFLSRYHVELSPFPNSNGGAHPKIVFGQLQLHPLVGRFINKNNNINNFLFCWRGVGFS